MPKLSKHESDPLIQPPQRKRNFLWCGFVFVSVCVCVCVGVSLYSVYLTEEYKAEQVEKYKAEKDKVDNDKADKEKAKKVAFSAGLGHAFTASNSEAWHVVKYHQVTLNDGGCYNPETGEFKVPVAGVYLVSSTSHISGMRAYMRLVNRPANNSGVPHQEVVIAMSDTYSGPFGGKMKVDGGFTASMTVPVQLSRGDRVVVQLCAGGRVYDDIDSARRPFSTFSVVLQYVV